MFYDTIYVFSIFRGKYLSKVVSPLVSVNNSAAVSGKNSSACIDLCLRYARACVSAVV